MKRMAVLISVGIGALAPGDASADGEAWDAPPPPDPGGCQTHAECMPGEFCSSDGSCEESGFCDSNVDCPVGFVCDERSTCVPDVPPPPPPACETIETELECILRPDCVPHYLLIRCACADGAPCCGAGCTCERYEFAWCMAL